MQPFDSGSQPASQFLVSSMLCPRVRGGCRSSFFPASPHSLTPLFLPRPALDSPLLKRQLYALIRMLLASSGCINMEHAKHFRCKLTSPTL